MMTRKVTNRLRAVAAAVAILAFLVYLNTSQMEDDSEAVLHSAGALNTSMTRVLAERRAASVQNAWIEYTTLVSAGLGAALALGAPRLLSLRLR